VWNLIAVLVLALAAPTEVAVSRLDGSSLSGQLESWTADEIVLSKDGRPQTIPAAELLAIEFATQPTADSGQPLLELVDGSTLPLAGFTRSGQQMAITLQPLSPAKPRPIKLPIDAVRAVRLKPIVAAALEQWQEIRALASPSDVLVVLKQGGQSLDYLECVINQVTDTEVAFKLDGKDIRVPRSKIAGLIFFRSNKTSATAPNILLVGRNGLKIVASTATLSSDLLHLHTATGVEITWPLADIVTADLSVGKVVFLSDLEPATVSWQPLIALPTAASHAASFGKPRFNESATGGPLTLVNPNDQFAQSDGPFLPFAKGLAIRSRSELVFRLPHGYNRFVTLAGIDPAAAATGNVLLSILGDGRLLLETTIAGDNAPLPIELDVANVKRLKFVVDYGENLDTGDWLNLCNARVVK